MSKATDLRARLSEPAILVAPGIYDALSAAIAEDSGFEAVFVSGSALAAAHLARPDIGLLSLSETAEIVGRIADRVTIPLFVDADQGGGNAFLTARHVRMLEKAGAAAIQIEDQQEVKDAADPLARPLVAASVMTDKIKAAKDACHTETVISARTDATFTEGAGKAIERAVAYVDAGADMIFVEGLKTRADQEQLVAAIGGRAPILHNLLRPGEEVQSAAELEALGYSAALFPAPALRAATAAIAETLGALKSDPVVAAPPSQSRNFLGGEAFLAKHKP